MKQNNMPFATPPESTFAERSMHCWRITAITCVAAVALCVALVIFKVEATMPYPIFLFPFAWGMMSFSLCQWKDGRDARARRAAFEDGHVQMLIFERDEEDGCIRNKRIILGAWLPRAIFLAGADYRINLPAGWSAEGVSADEWRELMRNNGIVLLDEEKDLQEWIERGQ